MPLPTENVEWPPSDLKAPLEAFVEWDMWYGGDPDTLAAQYEGDTSVGSRPWSFWSRRRPSTSTHARRERLHVPLPGDIATTSADLLFASPFDITVPSGTAETQERLDRIIEQGGILNRLLEAAEECAVFGGVYLRPTWDIDLTDVPILTHVTPDRAIPKFRHGLLVEVIFWRQISDADEKRVLRHLEYHYVGSDRKGVVEHALYEGTEDRIGRRVDLGEDPRTATLEDVQPMPFDGIDVRYVKNMGPARRLRGTPHGRSDFDGIEPLFDAVDETWNSWMRDLRLGKARLIVPGEYLERGPRGAGAYFDTDQEIFTPLEMDPTERDGAGIEKVQFAIRFAEHRATLDSLIMEAVGKAGYSAQTFGFHGESAMTATEVVARVDKTHRTTDKKRRYWEPNVEDVLHMLLAIDRLLGSKVTPERPDVEWPDLSEPTLRQLAETVELLNRAEAASTETLVRMQHPEWDDVQVADEVARIASSKPAPMPNPFDLGPEQVPDDVEPEMAE